MIKRIAYLLTLVIVSGCASLEMFNSPAAKQQQPSADAPYQPPSRESSHIVAPKSEIVAAKKSVSILQPVPVTMPARGLKMTQVRTNFGSPNKQIGAIGEPPITRWVYNEFTVYFEHQYVIDSVAHVKNSP